MKDERIDWFKTAPKVAQALFALAAPVKDSGLEPALLELVKLRTSQINGCAFCIDMHTKDARAGGETEQRLYLTQSWREAAHLYSDRERAALGWAEAVSRSSAEHEVSNEAYAAARAQFSEAELVMLTLAIVATSGWNRFNVAFHRPAGDYQPGMFNKLRIA